MIETARLMTKPDEESVIRTTHALCSTCGVKVPAAVIKKRGRILLRKQCPEHGSHEELMEEDAAFFARQTDFEKPPTPSRVETETVLGCPYDCGLCPQHCQHTCIGLLEVTDRCDLRCPVCYAGSGDGGLLGLEQASRMIDAFQSAERGTAEILQISGGEPTQHPQILELIRLAREKRVRYVMLNTNGLRLAREPEFANALSEFEKGFEVYLQFDGFGPEAHQSLRGRDLTDLKLRALENLAKHHVPTTLVTTVLAGENDDQLGRIFAFGLQAPYVRGINFQPAASFGRTDGIGSAGRVTRTGVLRRLEAQTAGILKVSDFIPLPCSVDTVAITLLVKNGESVLPLTRRTDASRYLPLLSNTLAFYPQDVLQEAFSGLCSGTACCSARFLKDLLPFAPTVAKGLLAKDRNTFTSERFFRVTVTSFLDRLNWEGRAAQRECVHVLTQDGRRIPFSAYNLIHRRGIEL